MVCLPLGDAAIRAGNVCQFGTHDPLRPKAMVWGDSHALALFRAYEEHAARGRLLPVLRRPLGVQAVPRRDSERGAMG